MLTALVSYFFGERLTDMLSGYRVLSRRFVKSFPALASGFEIETELTVHALQLRLPIVEVLTPYRDRPPASASKLRTVPDGIRILRLIARLVREERPLEFFSSIAALMAMTSLVLITPVVRRRRKEVRHDDRRRAISVGLRPGPKGIGIHWRDPICCRRCRARLMERGTASSSKACSAGCMACSGGSIRSRSLRLR